MNKFIYFLGYDAIGDHLSNNGMVRYLLNRYDKIILVTRLTDYVKLLYNDDKRISSVTIEEFEKISDLDLNFDVIDVRMWGINPRPGKYVGSYFNRENKIDNISNQIFTDNASYFYAYMGIDINVRLHNFYFARLIDKENDLFNKLKIKSNGYSVVCEFEKNLINRNYVNDTNLVNLHLLSPNFLDIIKIIENANEVHLLENSISLLVYHLQTRNLMNQCKVNLHAYSRQESHRKCTDPINGNIFLNMLTSPKLENWNYIYD